MSDTPRVTLSLVTSRAPAVAATLGLIGLSWWAGGATAGGSPLPLIVVVGGFAGLLAARRPRVVAIGVLVLGATVLPDQAVPFSIGGVRSDAAEGLAFLLLASWGVGLATSALPRPRFVLPVSLIMAGLALGLVVGDLNGSSRSILIGFGKGFALYLLLLAFSSLFATANQQDLLERWLLRLCTFGSVVTVLVAATGLRLVPGSRTTVVETLDATFDAQRIRTPVLALVTVGLLLLVGRIMDRGLDVRTAATTALYLVVVVLSFNRSTWVPLALAVCLLAVVRRGPRVPGRLVAVLLLGSLASGVLLQVALSGALGQTAVAAGARLTSITQLSVTDEKSYDDRQRETEVAVQALVGSPVVGVGVARPYGARRAFYSDDPPQLIYADRLFIHNSYLGIWLQLGILGLAGFLALGAQAFRESVVAARELPGSCSTRHLAAGLALLVFGLQALLQTSLLYRPTILASACALALLQRPIHSGAIPQDTRSIASRTTAAKCSQFQDSSAN